MGGGCGWLQPHKHGLARLTWWFNRSRIVHLTVSSPGRVTWGGNIDTNRDMRGEEGKREEGERKIGRCVLY